MIFEFPWDDLWICFESSQHFHGQGVPHHGVKGALLKILIGFLSIVMGI
jgi:hypothetical protein